jgi:hypothetical protein
MDLLIMKLKPNQNSLMSELLILPDGRILVQNLTQPMAELLNRLNPKDKSIASRVKTGGQNSGQKICKQS